MIKTETLNQKNEKVSVTLITSKIEDQSRASPAGFLSFNMEDTKNMKNKTNFHLGMNEKIDFSDKEVSNGSSVLSWNKTDESKNESSKIVSKDSKVDSEKNKTGFNDSNIRFLDQISEEKSQKIGENNSKTEIKYANDKKNEKKGKLEVKFSIGSSNSIKSLSREEEKSPNLSESKIFRSKKSLKEAETPKFVMKPEVSPKNSRILKNMVEKTSSDESIKEHDKKLKKTMTFGGKRGTKKQNTEPLEQYRSKYRPQTFQGLAMKYVKSEFSDKSFHENEKIFNNPSTISDETLEDQINLSVKDMINEKTTQNYQNNYGLETCLHDVSEISVNEENKIFTERDQEFNEVGEAVKHLVLFEKKSKNDFTIEKIKKQENYEKNESKAASIFIQDDTESMFNKTKSIFDYTEDKASIIIEKSPSKNVQEKSIFDHSKDKAAYSINKEKKFNIYIQEESLFNDIGQSPYSTSKDKSKSSYKEKNTSNNIQEKSFSNISQYKLKDSKILNTNENSLNLTKLSENIIKDIKNQTKNRPLFMKSFETFISLDPFDSETTKTSEKLIKTD